MVREEACVEQAVSVRGKRRSKRKRSVEEAALVLWMVIDEAKSYMADPLTTSEERRHWAKILTDTVGVLNKLLASMGEKQFEDEDLASLLTRIPRPLQKKIAGRVLMWRGMSSQIDYSATWVLRRRFPKG